MRGRRQKDLPVRFQMAPMIDIIFLLLIFFICVSTFDRLESEEDVDLPPAAAWKKLEKEDSTLLVNLKRNGKVTINQMPFLRGQVEPFLRSLVARYGDRFEVVVRADRNARYSGTKDVIRACARVGLTRISFAVEKRK